MCLRVGAQRQFFSIAHLITPEAYYTAFEADERRPAQGWTVSRITSSKKDVERKIQELYQRLKDGKYPARGIWALRRGTREEAGQEETRHEETRHLRLS